MNRRAFLTTALAVVAPLTTVARQRVRRILLRSSWQTVNIGDIAHTPGLPALLERRAPDDPSPDEGDGSTRPVGSYRPNPWGLYDMHGTVWEWAADDHYTYPAGPRTDPRGACHAPLKVIRGGSWRFRADSARCALRYTHAPADRGYSLGFRVVREAASARH